MLVLYDSSSFLGHCRMHSLDDLILFLLTELYDNWEILTAYIDWYFLSITQIKLYGISFIWVSDIT